MSRLIIVSVVLLARSAFAEGAVELSVDFSEAEHALKILHKQAAHEGITATDWQQLFATIPYQQLKAREASMGRPLSDEEFQTFLLAPAALAKLPEWDRAVASMKQADLRAIGERMLAWLPVGASIRARVFPLVKPRENSFVWTAPGGGSPSDPGIFLYLSSKTRAQFENTVAHECHHIGLGSLAKRQEALQAGLSVGVRKAVQWMSAFGEGEAMLAAAGSIDRHPHAEDDALSRARWDGDLMHFNADVAALQVFLNEVLDGKFKDDEAIMRRAGPFWGDAQGAWYTVGYEMSVLVERQFGRQALMECMMDPRQLLVLYNKVAVAANAAGATLAIWPPELLARLR